MGRPKHGKDSARSKSCAKYKRDGHYEINKKRKAEQIKNGTYHKKSKEKTKLMKMNNMIRNVEKVIPYCDSDAGVVWGTNKEDRKRSI